jgi:Calcineurin-like phosphoesterase
MPFLADPPIPVKIRKMKERIRWREPIISAKNIDQTRFVLDDGGSESAEFSFLVIGDTGAGKEQKYNPQRQVAEQMLPHLDSCRFVLHTGDVVYLAGSSEYYLDNFIKPYQEFLVGGDRPSQIAYDRMIFNHPILPIPGNHDYYDFNRLGGLLTGLTLPLRRLIKRGLDFDIGWHGSYQGQAYAEAFLDCLNRLPNQELLDRHLNQHYTAQTDTGLCLRYQPGQFTRLPNRYYTFRYGGIDFFALDSNTFNAPQPIPKTPAGDIHRRLLQERRSGLEQEKKLIVQEIARLNFANTENAEQLHDLQAKMEQIDESILDIDKHLATQTTPAIDVEQLNWLQERLINSWNTPEVRGRIIYFHHPPYVTEATKWQQAQTLAVRHHLRRVLDNVAAEIGSLKGNSPSGRFGDRPLVDLILNGHAHCLEHIQTLDTGHADSNLNWIVCGGSGFSLRRQREEGSQLLETFAEDRTQLVAQSNIFIGRNGQGSKKRRPYSFIRIDVQPGTPPKLVIRPFVVERFQKQWSNRELNSFVL